MVQLYDGGAYVLNGTEIIPDTADAAKILAGKMGAVPSREEAKKHKSEEISKFVTTDFKLIGEMKNQIEINNEEMGMDK